MHIGHGQQLQQQLAADNCGHVSACALHVDGIMMCQRMQIAWGYNLACECERDVLPGVSACNPPVILTDASDPLGAEEASPPPLQQLASHRWPASSTCLLCAQALVL